jgi:hypothetical protein
VSSDVLLEGSMELRGLALAIAYRLTAAPGSVADMPLLPARASGETAARSGEPGTTCRRRRLTIRRECVKRARSERVTRPSISASSTGSENRTCASCKVSVVTALLPVYTLATDGLLIPASQHRRIHKDTFQASCFHLLQRGSQHALADSALAVGPVHADAPDVTDFRAFSCLCVQYIYLRPTWEERW